MVLLDTNVFLIARFFQRDARHAESARLVEQLPQQQGAIYLFTLFELCGLASFNLSAQELDDWMYGFSRRYGVKVLDPPSLKEIEQFSTSIFSLVRRKMSMGDAFLLQAAEAYNVNAIITWNPRHFADRTHIPVWTPGDWMAQQNGGLSHDN
jgi:predicted nucleic acid-binding protein